MTISRFGRISGVVALSGLAVPFVPSSAAATTAWVATATQAMPASLLPGAALGSALASATAMQVVVSLPMQDRAGIAQAIAAGQTVPHATLEAEADPSRATVAAVTSYLASQGLTDITVTGDDLLVAATGTAGDVESAFDTSLSSVTLKGASYFTNTEPASVPTALAGDVVGVLGLNSLPITHLDATAPATSCVASASASDGVLCTYEPQDFQTAYGASTVTAASSTPIAIFGEGDLTGVVADYHQAKAEDGLPDSPISTVIPPGDTSSTDTSGADEFDLDTQLSTGLAQSVPSLTVYDASSLDDGPLALSFDDFATSDAQKAGSASFGGCESLEYLSGGLATDDQIFEMAAAQGQTVFASSGDTGSACLGVENGVPAAGVPGVEYPASSTYVVGVGGTSLVTSSTAPYTYTTEAAWPGSGGGTSTVEAAPLWQTQPNYMGYPAAEQDLTARTTGFKTVPDMANAADPNQSGAWVDVSGAYEGVGGTSLASPMSLGEWARIETAYDNKLGFAAPVLYALAGRGGIHDVETGDAGVQPATPGYDLATGIGSLDVAAAVSEIATLGLDNGGTGPGVNLPESPLAIALPIAGLLVGGLSVARIRRRRQRTA